MLAYGGEIVCVAGLPDLSDIEPFRAISIHEVALGGAYLSEDRIAQEELAKVGREFGALVSKGVVKSMLQEIHRPERNPRRPGTPLHSATIRGKNRRHRDTELIRFASSLPAARPLSQQAP